MKIIIKLTKIVMVASCALLFSCGEQPKDVTVEESDQNHIAIFAPHPLPENQREPFLDFLRALAVDRIGLADTITVYDATDDVSEVTSITVPSRDTYTKVPEHRMTALEKEFDELEKWVMASDTPVEGTLSINILEALRVAGTLNLSAETDSVVLVGSGIYDHALSLAWSMKGDGETSFVPKPVTVNMSPKECPYGTKGLTARLPEGLPVHFLHLEEYALFSAHKRAVEAYWALNVSARGGILRSAEIDPSLILGRLPTGYNGTITPAEPDPDGKAEMQQLKLPKPENEPNQTQVEPEFDFMTTPRITTAPLNIQYSNNIQCGIIWMAPPGTDLDVEVHYSSDMKPLFYGHNRNPDGAFFEKDIRTPAHKGVLELVHLNDVRVKLANLRVWVNNYKSPVSDKPIQVEFRLLIEGRVYSHKFTLPNNTGNRGADRYGERSSDYWYEIDILALLGKQ